MTDELLGGLLPDRDLRYAAAVTTGLCRRVRDLHKTEPAAAAVLAEGLTAAVLLASLQKVNSRINLQLECDGPLRGFFADADPEGHARGYAKNNNLEFLGQEGEFRWRPAFGNSGFLSVLRDQGGGEYYRSSVELVHFDVALDLQRYFETSEQLPTRVFLEVISEPNEPLAKVGGLIVQVLPGADVSKLEAIEAHLRSERTFTRALASSEGVRGLLDAAFPERDFEVLRQVPISHRCTCSRERVMAAVASMGKAELEDVLAKEKKAEVTCQFCSTQYVISGESRSARLVE